MRTLIFVLATMFAFPAYAELDVYEESRLQAIESDIYDIELRQSQADIAAHIAKENREFDQSMRELEKIEAQHMRREERLYREFFDDNPY